MKKKKKVHIEVFTAMYIREQLGKYYEELIQRGESSKAESTIIALHLLNDSIRIAQEEKKEQQIVTPELIP